jgi:hypothetical protein
MGFWQWFWLLVVTYFFVALLVALFQIVVDLFRDKQLSGWWKALWMLILIAFPILGAVAYLAIRGRSMAERHAVAAVESRKATESYIQTVAAPNPTEQIASAKALLDSGAITQAEFDALKQKAMS